MTYFSDDRFIDTAGDLELEGVTDPLGKHHLAELLGHLFDLKVVSSHSSQ